MGVQGAPYSLRLDRTSMQKIRVLSAKECRSINMQLCIAVERYLEEYEKEHGEIPVPPEAE